MSILLAKALRHKSSRPVTVNGQKAYASLRLAVSDGDKITVRRLGASTVRAQAIKMKLDRGDLRANGIIVGTAALWSHTAPNVASLTVLGKRAKQLTIWNAWSHEGVDSSWVGNAGMTATKRKNGVLLRCSDGVGKVNFSDLEVEISIISP